MGEMWGRWLRKGLHVAHNLWWDHDHVSHEVVQGRHMKADAYRARGCMRLVRAAPRDAENTFDDTTPACREVPVRRGLAPAGAVVRGHRLRV
ncbi:MAG: hypothetical protein KIT60_11305 [Burkholderiaceae bacterium]|nr:hypothetical protein [Burkholderiaceae bacterium]